MTALRWGVVMAVWFWIVLTVLAIVATAVAVASVVVGSRSVREADIERHGTFQHTAARPRATGSDALMLAAVVVLAFWFVVLLVAWMVR
jgi:hypothetical protein